MGGTPEDGFEGMGSNPDVVAVPGALIVRPNSGLFFGAVDRERKEVIALAAADDAGIERVCPVLTASFRLSLPVLESLGELEKQLARSSRQLWLVGLPSTARAELARDELAERMGAQHIVRTIGQAL